MAKFYKNKKVWRQIRQYAGKIEEQRAWRKANSIIEGYTQQKELVTVASVLWDILNKAPQVAANLSSKLSKWECGCQKRCEANKIDATHAASVLKSNTIVWIG